MNRKFTVAIATTILGCGLGLNAQTPPSRPPTPPQAVVPGQGDADTAKITDQAFVSEAAMGGMAEVELGRLAATKASNEKVKAFGQRMVTDHGKGGDELKTLAMSKHITLPASIDAKHQAVIDKFAKLSGADFDRAYVHDMVADHKKDVAAFEKEAMSGKDSDVKAWAAKTLPTLREHLRMIEDLEKELEHARATR